MTRDSTHISAAGLVGYDQVPRSIGVIEDPDEPMPIGIAFEAGWIEGAPAVWRLTVDDADVAGRWVIVDREFRPVIVADESTVEDSLRSAGSGD
jgi:hypothetical protein